MPCATGGHKTGRRAAPRQWSPARPCPAVGWHRASAPGPRARTARRTAAAPATRDTSTLHLQQTREPFTFERSPPAAARALRVYQPSPGYGGYIAVVVVRRGVSTARRAPYLRGAALHCGVLFSKEGCRRWVLVLYLGPRCSAGTGRCSTVPRYLGARARGATASRGRERRGSMWHQQYGL